MKNLSQKFAASLLVSLVSAGLYSAAPSDAHACSPPQQGIFERGTEHSQTLPIDGALVFKVYRYDASFDTLSIDVTNSATGAIIEGTTKTISTQVAGSSSVDANGEFLVVWHPNEQFALNTAYTAMIRATDPNNPEQFTLESTANFLSTRSPAQPGEASFGGDLRPGWTETPSGQECCPIDLEQMPGSCSDEFCWYTRYDYLPTLTFKVTQPATSAPRQVYHTLSTDDGHFEVIWDVMGDVSSHSITFPTDAQSPYCVTLETRSVVSDNLLSADERCVGSDAFPTYEQRPYEGEGRPDFCAEEPDAGGGDDVGPDAGPDAGPDEDVRPDDDVRPDTGPMVDARDPSDDDVLPNRPDTEGAQDATSTADVTTGEDAGDPTKPDNGFNGAMTGAGCGCASTPGSPTPLASALLFLGALFGLRRRTKRS